MRLAPALLLLLSATALADEYAVTSFSGGYEAPPAEATTVIGAGADDVTVAVDLPFEFPFFGGLHDTVSVCSNGWIAFGTTTDATSSNAALPDPSAPDGIVAALWDDLATGTGSVLTFTTGSAPNRTFVVSWEGVDTFSATETDDMSFQVRLEEADGTIEVAYAATGTWDGLSYTAGIEDPTGTVAFGGPGTGNANSGQPAADQRFEPSTSTLSGTLLRDRPVADASGLGNSVESDLPVVGADVVVRRVGDGRVAARGRTDATGAWTATVRGADVATTLSVEVSASGAAARVIDDTAAVYSHPFAGPVDADPVVALGTVTLDATVDAADPAFREALNIQQAAERGLAYARVAAEFAAANAVPPTTPETFERLDFHFSPGGGVSGYAPAAAATGALATISDSAANPDGYDDDVILREYAHHVLATISSNTTAITTRSWSAPTGQLGAFADGFAHWFACVLAERSVFVDTTAADAALTFDLEGPDPAATGDQATGAVAASLWELVDPANEPEDEFDGSTGPPPFTAADVLATLDIALDDSVLAGVDVQSFFDAWRAGGPTADREQTARAFIHHGTLPDDAFEPNDREGEAADPGIGVRKLEALTLSPFNEDHFLVGLGSMAVLTVTVQQTSDADLDVEVLDGGGSRVAFATNVGLTEGRDTISAVTSGVVLAGTYRARVVWRAGARTDYSLSFFDPFALLTTVLPEWTAGVPFKEDLFATGGVEPYRFVTTTDAPGLSAATGTRVEGTPTTAGDYSVDVRVSDSAAPANELEVRVPLRVNAPLSLPTLFGVAEERDVALDAGTGGTAAVWTAGGSPPAGLSVDGGATLRLSGTTPGPATFEISGSATDAVGAVLDPTTARIVVTAAADGAPVAPVPAGEHFGFFFDGLAESTLRLRFRFRGSGERPRFLALVDDAGGVVVGQGDPHVREFGRVVRVRGVALPSTGRFHVLFAPAGTPFTGNVVLRSVVRPPRGSRGQVAIDTVDAVVDVPFEALAGSVLTVSVQRSPSPTTLRPRVFEVRDPDGQPVALPAQRRRARGRRARLPRTRLPLDGTYVLRLSGDASTTGPLFYRYRIFSPRGARFDAD